MEIKSRHGDTWTLDETDWGYIWENPPAYTRFGFFPDSHHDICFVDPPGGPFIEVGQRLKGGKEIITNIKEGTDQAILIYTHKEG